jgi:hypothetical protein
METVVCTKAETSICSRDAGKEIDFNAKQPANVSFSIRRSLLFGSKVTFPIELPAKHFAVNSSTDDGIQIDFSETHPQNAPDSI